jgi:8-oxo-dGTP pyrophosphatase MutT (NUDIX family)
MSSLFFSANSLKKHLRFDADGFVLFGSRILPLLEKLCPADLADPELRRLFGNPQATLRANQPAHITTSSILLSRDSRRVMLLFHRKIGEWVYPGGHADGDWHLLRSALRECFEETSLSELEVCPPRALLDSQYADLCPHLFQRFSIRSTEREPAHIHFDAVFVLRAVHDEPAACDPLESAGLKWISVDEIKVHAARGTGVVDGFDALTARICVRGMQSALGPEGHQGRMSNL